MDIEGALPARIARQARITSDIFMTSPSDSWLSADEGWDSKISDENSGAPGEVDQSKYPPAEPEALRLLAPQRGLIATGESKSKNKSKDLAMQMSITRHSQTEGEHIPVTVKLLLPPRQSRGISLLE